MVHTAQIMQGNEACVEGALLAGCRFFAGYPITPATEIAEGLARRLPGVGGVFVQMEDEIASISAVIGAAWGGMKAMTATAGPGFTLMQEGIGYAAVTETPCVIVNVQRGGPATGQPTLPSQQDVMQARYGSHGDYSLIVLAPSSAQEMLDLTIRAFNLAEGYRVPVLVLADEIVGHTREKVLVPRAEDLGLVQRPQPQDPMNFGLFRPEGPLGIPPMPSFGEGYALVVDGQLHDEYGRRAGDNPQISAALVRRLCHKIDSQAEALADYDAYRTDDAEVIVVAYGSVSRSALRAVKDARQEGLAAGCLTLRTLWPFPEESLRRVCAPAKKVFVPEMNIGKMVREVDRALGGHKKVVSLPKLGGLLHTPAEIAAALKEE